MSTADQIREHNDKFLQAMAEAAKTVEPYGPGEIMRGCIVPVSELVTPPSKETILRKIRSLNYDFR